MYIFFLIFSPDWVTRCDITHIRFKSIQEYVVLDGRKKDIKTPRQYSCGWSNVHETVNVWHIIVGLSHNGFLPTAKLQGLACCISDRR